MDQSPTAPAGARLAAPAERLALSVPEAATALGVSRAFLFKLMKAGSITPVRLGRRTVIARSELERVLAEGAQ